MPVGKYALHLNRDRQEIRKQIENCLIEMNKMRKLFVFFEKK